MLQYIGRPAIALFLGLAIPACGTIQADLRTPSPSATTPAPRSSQPPPSAATATPDALGERTVATIELGGGPDMPTEAFGSMWVLAVDGSLLYGDGTDPAVHRIDPDTNMVIASIPLPGRLCQGLGASPEAIWACGPDGLIRIDPTTNEAIASIPLQAPFVFSRIPYGAGSVWAFATTTVGPDRVVRIDPSSNAVTATIDLDHVAGTMAFGFDALWVSAPADHLLLRIDPATNAVDEWTSGLERPGLIAVGEDSLWISLLYEHAQDAGEDEATVTRIDPSTGEVVASIATGGGLGDEGGIAAAADAIWVRGPSPWLVRIDPATNEVIERIDARGGPGDVAVAFDTVWATNFDYGEILRIEP